MSSGDASRDEEEECDPKKPLEMAHPVPPQVPNLIRKNHKIGREER